MISLGDPLADIDKSWDFCNQPCGPSINLHSQVGMSATLRDTAKRCSFDFREAHVKDLLENGMVKFTKCVQAKRNGTMERATPMCFDSTWFVKRPHIFHGARQTIQSTYYCGWTKSCTTKETLVSDDSPANANKQFFPPWFHVVVPKTYPLKLQGLGKFSSFTDI